MYSAKAAKEHFAVYEPRAHSRLRREHRLAFDLELALDRDEIAVHYQPIVLLDDGRLHAVEALVRWDHPTRGLLLPDDFLPAAEENGMMVEIGKRVVGLAFDDLRGVVAPETLGLWLNLGPAELTGDRLMEGLAVAMARAGIDPDALTVEITESGVFRDEQRAIAAMSNLRELGVHLSIDDFGTGYSSLSRLAELPIESVKIPLPFVSRLVGDDQNETFVDAIIRLADSLGLATVAEGIEHPGAVHTLRRLGCSLGQGHLFSEPLSAAELLPLLEDPKRLRSVVSGPRLSIAAAG
jgi:EAL domain-containing protein (putative c-di-GMP-specific phosphodiesterase class I)